MNAQKNLNCVINAKKCFFSMKHDYECVWSSVDETKEINFTSKFFESATVLYNLIPFKLSEFRSLCLCQDYVCILRSSSLIQSHFEQKVNQNWCDESSKLFIPIITCVLSMIKISKSTWINWILFEINSKLCVVNFQIRLPISLIDIRARS